MFLCNVSSCRKTEQSPETLWEKTYGGSDYDRGGAVQQTFDGGYIIVGYTESYGIGSGNVYLIKTDANGDTLWTRAYGLTYEGGYSVQQTTDQGYIIVGYTDSFGAGEGDVYLLKTDTNGDFLWAKAYGGQDNDCAHSVQQTSDGGYIIAGWTYSYGAGNGDVYLIKTDSNGDTLWTEVYGGSEFDSGTSVKETSDGGFIVTGWTESFGAGGDVYLIRTNADGDTLWTRAHGGQYQDFGESVLQTQDDGYLITGSSKEQTGHMNHTFLLKTDVDGDTIWTRRYDAGCGFSVQQTSDGGYVVVGHHMPDFPQLDVYLIKTDANGDVLWEKSFGGGDDDEGYSVQQTSDGGYIIVGRTRSFGAGDFDVYLIKTEPDINE